MASEAVPDGMTADKLRHIAEMLDLMDVILDKVEFRMGEEPIDASSIRGSEMQADLRTWADWLAGAEVDERE